MVANFIVNITADYFSCSVYKLSFSDTVHFKQNCKETTETNRSGKFVFDTAVTLLADNDCMVTSSDSVNSISTHRSNIYRVFDK